MKATSGTISRESSWSSQLAVFISPQENAIVQTVQELTAFLAHLSQPHLGQWLSMIIAFTQNKKQLASKLSGGWSGVENEPRLLCLAVTVWWT